MVFLLEKDCGFSISFVLISAEDFLKEKAELPDCWKEDLARKNVLFIPNQIHKSIIVNYASKSKLQNKIAYVGRKAIFWGKYNETKYLKSIYYKKRIKKDFYKYISILNGKNIKTTEIVRDKEE